MNIRMHIKNYMNKFREVAESWAYNQECASVSQDSSEQLL